MKSYTLQEAYDAILAKFNAGWIAGGYDASNIIYEETTSPDDLPPSTETWCRVFYRLADVSKTSLSDMNKTASYSRRVVLSVQLFSPNNKGREVSNELNQKMLDLFEKGDSSLPAIWFIDVDVKEIGPDGPWFFSRLNVTVNFFQSK